MVTCFMWVFNISSWCDLVYKLAHVWVCECELWERWMPSITFSLHFPLISCIPQFQFFFLLCLLSFLVFFSWKCAGWNYRTWFLSVNSPRTARVRLCFDLIDRTCMWYSLWLDHFALEYGIDKVLPEPLHLRNKTKQKSNFHVLMSSEGCGSCSRSTSNLWPFRIKTWLAQSSSRSWYKASTLSITMRGLKSRVVSSQCVCTC